MDYNEKQEITKAMCVFGDTMDYYVQKRKAIEKANKSRIMPRYHLNDDGEMPIVVDIKLEYPNEKLKFIYERGYCYLGKTNGEKLFMDEHCMSDDKETVEKEVKYLIRLRKKDYNNPDHPLHALLRR